MCIALRDLKSQLFEYERWNIIKIISNVEKFSSMQDRRMTFQIVWNNFDSYSYTEWNVWTVQLKMELDLKLPEIWNPR